MIQQMKKQLMEDHSLLQSFLEEFGYSNFKEYDNYITFGRDEESSPKSIVIRTDDNDGAYVHDYAKNIVSDVIGFVMKEKNQSFITVLNVLKKTLGVEEGCFYQRETKIFGGMFSKVAKKKTTAMIPLNESVLSKYKQRGNVRFIRDGISLDTQKSFGIGFSINDETITIPIRAEDGTLIGVKGRINREPRPDESKYYYLYPCHMSETLYGYCQNYDSLLQAEDVYIFESEKSVMQAYEMGYRNAVAMGSSSLSKHQCRLIGGLGAKRIVLMHDQGIKDSVIERNCNMLRSCCPMKEFEICYWTPEQDIPAKASPTDLGKERFEIAINEEIKKWI